MNTLTTQERLAESELPVDVFGASAEAQQQPQQLQQHPQPQQLEAEQDKQDHSKSQYLSFLRKMNHL